MLVSAPAAAEGEQAKPPEYDLGAKVKIELRMEDGTIVKHRGELRSYGNDWTFDFEGADHTHQVVLNVEGSEGESKLDVTLSYSRDGSLVIPPFTTDFTAKKREVLWTEDGTLALALLFTPTKFPREDKTRDDKDKIAPGEDNDDPLGGGNLLK